MTAPDGAYLAQRLARCYSGAVFDAMRERGHANCLLPTTITPLVAGPTVAGPAFTVSGSPKLGLTDDETLVQWTTLLALAPAGSIVVLQGNDHDRALMGELSAETLLFRGVTAFVTDGGCRDTAFIERIGFPVFCAYRTPRDVVGSWTPDAYGQRLRFGDVCVHDGDFVVADRDGVVVVPRGIAEEITLEVEAVTNTESRVRRAILEGVDPREAYARFGRF